MDDVEFELIKNRINEELVKFEPDVGIAFGSLLFSQFAARKLIALEETSLLGIMPLPFKLPAYQKTHYAFVHWALRPREYLIGGSPLKDEPA